MSKLVVRCPRLTGVLGTVWDVAARTVLAMAVVTVAAGAFSDAAGADEVQMSPSGSGAPGGALVQQLVNWLGQFALWGSLLAMLGGAAIMGISQNSGGYGGATKGKILAIGGAIGAVVTGLAPSVINLLFGAANT